MGLASHDDSAADIDIFPIFMPVDAGDPLINLETVIINASRNYLKKNFLPFIAAFIVEEFTNSDKK